VALKGNKTEVLKRHQEESELSVEKDGIVGVIGGCTAKMQSRKGHMICRRP
jgi:hypothetical protein